MQEESPMERLDHFPATVGAAVFATKGSCRRRMENWQFLGLLLLLFIKCSFNSAFVEWQCSVVLVDITACIEL